MTGEMILIMMIGFAGIIFLINSNISQSRNKEQIRKSEELENKIKLQPFILAAKNMYPLHKLKLYDRSVVLEGPLLNFNNKKIGKIEISGHRSITYSSNEPLYLVIVGIMIDEKYYEARREHIQESFEILKSVITDLSKEVMNNQELQKRIIATTY